MNLPEAPNTHRSRTMLLSLSEATSLWYRSALWAKFHNVYEALRYSKRRSASLHIDCDELEEKACCDPSTRQSLPSSGAVLLSLSEATSSW